MATTDQEKQEQLWAAVKPCENLPQYIEKFTGPDNDRQVLGFPSQRDEFGKFELLTGAELGRLLKKAACHYLENLLEDFPEGEPQTIAMFGAGDCMYLAAFFGLSLLGHSIVLISPKQSALALGSMLDRTAANIILFDGELSATVDEACKGRSIKRFRFASREDINRQASGDGLEALCKRREMAQVAFYWHSSGSTGVPKLFPMTQEATMSRIKTYGASGRKYGDYFITSAIYNSAGSTHLLAALSTMGITYFYNDRLPYTAAGLSEVLNEAKPEQSSIIPYALEKLVSTSAGLDALKHNTAITSFGSLLPKDVGDRVTAAGVRLNLAYASSETSIVMSSSSRPVDDNEWEYMNIVPTIQQHILMRPVDGQDLHECIVLAGMPNCPYSNSEDPPGSYHTRDVFVKHPRGFERWKFVGRLDDMINMSIPVTISALSFEEKVKEHNLVEEAAMFGDGRPHLGLLAFYNGARAHPNPAEFIEEIWPAVEQANARIDEKGRVEKNMVIAADAAQVPRTDKQNFVRPRLYQQFAEEIDQKYAVARQ